jgi:cyclic beta-1,2-glucan glucanotransferase
MTAQAATVSEITPQVFPPLIGHRGVVERLEECARLLGEKVRSLQAGASESGAARWLIDNHSFVQTQIAGIRRSLNPSYVRKLIQAGQGTVAGEPRVYRVAAELLGKSSGGIDYAQALSFAPDLKKRHALVLGELWAFGVMLRLATIERLVRHLDREEVVSASIRSLVALDGVSWREFVEAASPTEELLRADPARVYQHMDFETRDLYRRELEKLTRRCPLDEQEIARALIERARSEKRHIGSDLIGPGARAFRKAIQCRVWPLGWVFDLAERWPSLFYVIGFALCISLLLVSFLLVAGPFPKWMVVFLLIPASQAALEIINAVVSRLCQPRLIPSLDFSTGIPDEHQTIAVIPTLLFSAANVTKLLEDLEIRYLANRGPNLYFALLTDFPDSEHKTTAADDAILAACVEGIHKLNARYGFGDSGPFYLFHRSRTWNDRERKWMGYERKRGKLNDLNKLLLGEGNWFETVLGDVARLGDLRYVITLDTDTRLPRDMAAKMAGAMAHPLNRPVVDPVTSIVTEGYALLRPRVAVSMESSGRSRLAQIFSGQPGFDPYATSVSDVYQDLHGQASFTGKGIYDVRAFHAAVGDRFPENAILSHDLIEGEHARTGLLTSVELVEDYPATYAAFSKRKHRWVRGDWQLLPWLFRRPPVPGGRARGNPLSLLSRWKILDNLRRSLFEISVLLLLAAGWIFLRHSAARWTLAVLLLLQLPAYADLLLSLAKAPERQLWPAFARHLGKRFVQCHRDMLLILALIPHQACLMVDAIVRTLGRLFLTRRKMLEWETMAQSESAARRLGRPECYLYLAALIGLPFLFGFAHLHLLVALVCATWVVAPLIVGWLNEPLPPPAVLPSDDRGFLREVALRTWRFFADHSNAENHWLIPDNVQQTPPLVAPGISPTNLGFLLTAQLAAYDFGYLNLDQLSRALESAFETLEKIPRYRGHFFNWYDTRTLCPMPPHYVSAVDSGNLGASLCTLRQGCLSLINQPIVEPSILAGLRDHVLRLRGELPYTARTHSLMRLLDGLLRQLDYQPGDLFSWEAVLIDTHESVERLRQVMANTHTNLRCQGERAKSDELRYWECLISERTEAALSELYLLAPWLRPALEPELRVNLLDTSLGEVFAEISPVPALSRLPEIYDRISERLAERLADSRPLYPRLRSALERLLTDLPQARLAAVDLIQRHEKIAQAAARYVEEMDFGFLFDARRKLLRIGYNVDNAQADEACYDLLASEARTAVFLAIAKGDIPREAWFRLGRKLTVYRDQRSLKSWSGTMFEYLMPLLHLRCYTGTLLECGMRGAIRIQQLYAAERKVPWGISESAYSARDGRMQYQYRAFGVPALSSRSDRSDQLVIAPYASMLALMLDPARAAVNLRELAARGYWSRYGFIEAIDYSAGNVAGGPEPIRCFMAHHQGMGLLAINNALFGGRMQERFHLEPFIQATEFLLQERMPALVEHVADGGARNAAA